MLDETGGRAYIALNKQSIIFHLVEPLGIDHLSLHKAIDISVTPMFPLSEGSTAQINTMPSTCERAW